MQEVAAQLEQTHVHDVYTRIAHHFQNSNLESKAWPKVKYFIESLPVGSLVADIGCGTGKYLSLTKCILGSDRCENLVHIAASQGHEVMVCDNLNLPYRDACFDALISIGVIHHMTTRGRRRQAIEELARVLRTGGTMYISVWAMEQSSRKFKAQDILVPLDLENKSIARIKNYADQNENHVKSKSLDMNDRQMMAHLNRSQNTDTLPNISLIKDTTKPNQNYLNGKLRTRSISEHNPSETKTFQHRILSLFNTNKSNSNSVENTKDIAYRNLINTIISNQNIEDFKVREFPASSTTLTQEEEADAPPLLHDDRYYHVFKEGELVELIAKIKDLQIIKDYYDHANWCVIVQKL